MPNPDHSKETPPRRPKQSLLMRMYFDRCLTDITRTIGYHDVPADEALERMTPLIERYGKEKVIAATTELLDVDSTAKPVVARLKADVRRFAFQMLGPPPDSNTPSPSPDKKPPVEPSAVTAHSEDAKPDAESRPLKQPRTYVLKLFEEWLKVTSLVYVGTGEMKRSNPAVKPFIGSVDFIVLRGDAKMFVTVRPQLQATNIDALRALQKLFGPEYTAVRFWPNQAPDAQSDLLWREYPVNL